MKKSELKVGDVVQFRNGQKRIIGLYADVANKEDEILCLKVFNSNICSLESSGDLSYMTEDLKAKYEDCIENEIVRVWREPRALFGDNYEPIWENNFAKDLKINSLIWVRDYEDDGWQIAIFKGIDIASGRVMANEVLEEEPYKWNYAKEFNMKDLEV